jgi:hypothetical protein
MCSPALTYDNERVTPLANPPYVLLYDRIQYALSIVRNKIDERRKDS